MGDVEEGRCQAQKAQDSILPTHGFTEITHKLPCPKDKEQPPQWWFKVKAKGPPEYAC